MLKTIANLKNVTVLSREAQRKIGGGAAAAGGTCAYIDGNGEVQRLVSKKEAIAGAKETAGLLGKGSGHWCCQSCDKAAWF